MIHTSYLSYVLFFVFVPYRDAVSEGPSLIELAYDVLVKGKTRQDFDPNDCEEFVEQCKAYAGQLAQDEKRCETREHKRTTQNEGEENMDNDTCHSEMINLLIL